MGISATFRIASVSGLKMGFTLEEAMANYNTADWGNGIYAVENRGTDWGKPNVLLFGKIRGGGLMTCGQMPCDHATCCVGDGTGLIQCCGSG